MRGRIVIWALVAASALLLAVGAGLLLFAPTTASFGWYAYAPLSSTAFSPVDPFTPERVVGTICVGLGVAVGTGVLGWVLGRRSALRTRDGATHDE